MRSKRPLSLASRISAVTNSFVQCLLPDVAPSKEETEAALAVLGQAPGHTVCVYCGDPAVHADHLVPLVQNRRPSGYLNDYRNRVPACGACNTSKGGQDWRRWMRGSAANGLRARGVSAELIEQRIAILDRFEKWAAATPINLEKVIGHERWQAYWDRLDQIESLMRAAQTEATALRGEISIALERSPSLKADVVRLPEGELAIAFQEAPNVLGISPDDVATWAEASDGAAILQIGDQTFRLKKAVPAI